MFPRSLSTLTAILALTAASSLAFANAPPAAKPAPAVAPPTAKAAPAAPVKKIETVTVASAACKGKSAGEACNFTDSFGTIKGACQVSAGTLMCGPALPPAKK